MCCLITGAKYTCSFFLFWPGMETCWWSPCAVELCTLWRPSPGLRLGTPSAIVDCSEDGASPAQSATHCPQVPDPHALEKAAQGTKAVWSASQNLLRTPSFFSTLITLFTASSIDPSAVFPALSGRFWHSLIKSAVNWFPHWISTAV